MLRHRPQRFQFLASSGTRNSGGYSNPRPAQRPRDHLRGPPIVYAGVSNGVKDVQFFADRQVRVAFAQPA